MRSRSIRRSLARTLAATLVAGLGALPQRMRAEAVSTEFVYVFLPLVLPAVVEGKVYDDVSEVVVTREGPVFLIELFGASDDEASLVTCQGVVYGGICSAGNAEPLVDFNEPPAEPGHYVESDAWDPQDVGVDYCALVNEGASWKMLEPGSGGEPEVAVETGDEVPWRDPGTTWTSFGSDCGVGECGTVFSTSCSSGEQELVALRTCGSEGGPPTLALLADSTQARPRGGGFFEQPTSVAMWGDRAVWTDSQGVYTMPMDGTAAPTQPVAAGDSHGTGTLSAAFSRASVSGDRVAFRCATGGGDCIALADLTQEGAVTLIAGNATPIPGGTGNFGPLQNPAVGGETVVFEAFSASFQYLGLFVSHAGELAPLALRNDELFGKTVFTASVGPKGIAPNGEQIAVTLHFTDGTAAVGWALFVLLADDFESGDFDGWTLP